MENALIILVSNTEKGNVKPRLAKELGEEKTIRVYKYLLKNVAEVTNAYACHRFVFYSDYIHLNDVFDDLCFTKSLQEGASQAEILCHAFEKAFSLGHQKVCMVTADCPELQQRHLEEAFAYLDKQDVVVGPTTDGGLYLLGMRQPNAALLNKNWGTNAVYEDVLVDLEKLQFTYSALEELDDIDLLEDLLETNILAAIEEEDSDKE
jgi:rSAM/selenodomain-associated transferase 1